MSPKHRIWLVGLAAGAAMPAATFQDERQRGPSAGRWTAPGWYILEHRGSGHSDLLRAGPFGAEAACLAARRGLEPVAPDGHPELDLLTCRELKQAPSA